MKNLSNLIVGITIGLLFIVFIISPNYITFALIIAIAVLIVFIWRNADVQKQMYSIPTDALNIVNVDKGGVFTLTGVGKDSEEMTLKVLWKHLYQEGDFFWYELECDNGTGENVWVEVEDDDRTVVSIVLKKLTLGDIGITPAKLVKIDDEESGSITYHGQRFSYTDSDNAVFYKYCDDKKPEKFYYWDFTSKNQIISVEKWSDTEYDVTLSQIMLPPQITVLSNKG